MGTPTKYADVILPLALNRNYTYKIPEALLKKTAVGKRAVVQFGKKRVYSAIIRNIHNKKPGDYKIKEITSVLDEYPIVNDFQLKLWEWLAEYYMCSVGEVMKAALPSGLKLESFTKLIYNEDFKDFCSLTNEEKKLINFLYERKICTIHEFQTICNHKNIINLIKNLISRKALFVQEELKQNYKPLSETYVKLGSDYRHENRIDDLLETLSRAKKQKELLLTFLDLTGIFSGEPQKELIKSALLKKTNASYTSFNQLVKKGVFEEYQKKISRIPELDYEPLQNNFLTELQKSVLTNIKTSLQDKNVALLHGVTSSGKTQIYIELIKEQIHAGKQVLYLLPEIALTTQIIKRLQAVFHDKVGVYHSKFNDAERVEIYKSLIDEQENLKNYKIILGVRSSVFLPFDNLGLVIIDEEHENTYKQFDPAPRYNARDTAIMLASYHNAKVVLGTATPSIESFFNAMTGKYGYVEMKKRYLDIQMPEIILVDLIRARKKKRMVSIFTRELIDNIEEALNNKEQVILFQNRRGFSPFIECADCGWIPKCRHCDVTLTYHKQINTLVCHYCGYSVSSPSTCQECKGSDIQTKGFGTEKIEEEIGLIFPDAKTQRMDLDTTRGKNSYENIIGRFDSGETDILIGTQMISKGLDFDNVRVVGILNADNMLNYPDFRAFERSYQLIAQVSGRAGRKNKQGKVVIQTSSPDHTILEMVMDNRYEDFYKNELLERKNFSYPPYCRIISLTLKHNKPEVLDRMGNMLGENLKKTLGKRVLGPQKPYIGRIKKYYIKRIVVKVEKQTSYIKAKEIVLNNIEKTLEHPNFKSGIISIDVDPM